MASPAIKVANAGLAGPPQHQVRGIKTIDFAGSQEKVYGGLSCCASLPTAHWVVAKQFIVNRTCRLAKGEAHCRCEEVAV